jgi:hypothetical protein
VRNTYSTRQLSVVERLRQKILKLDLLIELLSENLVEAASSCYLSCDRNSRLMESDRNYKEAVKDLRRALAAQADLELELDLISTHLARGDSQRDECRRTVSAVANYDVGQQAPYSSFASTSSCTAMLLAPSSNSSSISSSNSSSSAA